MTNNVRILPTGTLVRESGKSQFFNKSQVIPMDDRGDDAGDGLEDFRSSSMFDRNCLFPRFKECAHFHYESVDITSLELSIVGQKLEADPSETWWFYVLVSSEIRGWTIKRNISSLVRVDKLLHQCIFNRSSSKLTELHDATFADLGVEKCFKLIRHYIESLSLLLQENMDSVICGPVLAWLEVDNRGNHASFTEMDSSVNIPAIGAAQVIKPYVAQSNDELTFEVGDIISIIDKPPPCETNWWQGKKDFKVGYFPSEYVEMITVSKSLSPNLDRNQPEQLLKPVLRKREKFVALLLSFFTSRPNKVALKRAGIVKERLFGCDLGEYLSNHNREVPAILTSCIKFIEGKCITDGVYRLSGAVTNVQKLRNEFDADNLPNLFDSDIIRDLHSVPSLIKMYFRELPNPLLTHQLYEKFLDVEENQEPSSKLMSFACLMNLLPPPHYRTAKTLFTHLNLMATRHSETSMSSKNLAIIWAPNILQPGQDDQAMSIMKKMNVQASIVQKLIDNAGFIFKDLEIKQDVKPWRPMSSANCPAKLITLEEAQRIFGCGRGAPNFPPLAEKAEEDSSPHIHTIINLPKGFVGRKKMTPQKAKWFKSHQDLPSLGLAKPIQMTDFRRIGSTKRDTSPVQTRTSLGSPEDMSNSKPLSNSDPNMLDSGHISPVVMRFKSQMNEHLEHRSNLQTSHENAKIIPPPSKAELKVARENLSTTNSLLSEEISREQSEKKAENSNQTKISAKREHGTMLRKMEKFLQGEIIVEEGMNEGQNDERSGDHHHVSGVPVACGIQQDMEGNSVILTELLKWKDLKMKKNLTQVPDLETNSTDNKLAPSPSFKQPERTVNKLRRSLLREKPEQEINIAEPLSVKLKSSFHIRDELDSPRDATDTSPTQMNQHNNTIDFHPPPGCHGTSYVEVMSPNQVVIRKKVNRKGPHKSLLYDDHHRLSPRLPQNNDYLDYFPQLSYNFSHSCGDLVTNHQTSYGAFIAPPNSAIKSSSNENIYSEEFVRISQPQKQKVCRIPSQPLAHHHWTDQNIYHNNFYANLRTNQTSASKDRLFSYHTNMPHSPEPTEKFVTIINLESPEISPSVPGATVIML